MFVFKEQKNKAIEHAKSQQKKVDGLKEKLQEEKLKNQSLESHLKEAQKKNGYLEKAVHNLRTVCVTNMASYLIIIFLASSSCEVTYQHYAMCGLSLNFIQILLDDSWMMLESL